MKVKSLFIAIATIAAGAQGCRKSTESNSLNPEKGYFRFINLDYRVSLYWDGKINVNGDSVIFNPDGSVFGAGNKYGKPTRTYVNGGWNDNTPLTSVGTYSYVIDDITVNGISQYSYYPNPTLRSPLAPIIGSLNYDKWASIDAGAHKLTLKQSVPTFVNGVQVDSKLEDVLSVDYALEPAALHTVFLVNRSQARSAEGGFPIYKTANNNSYYGTIPDIVTIKDHPLNLMFNDSSAYIRFLNFTPAFFDATLNQTTAFLDVYLTPVYKDGSEGRDTLVAGGLERFANATDLPFFEIKLNPWLRGDTVGRNQYFRIKVFKQGESQATKSVPLASSLIPIFNQISTVVTDAQGNERLNSTVNSWLMRSDGEHFFPSINTIAFGLSNRVGGGGSLLLRSCIVYKKAGINNRYLQ